MGTRLGGTAVGVLLACGWMAAAVAGIPEAGMVLYGQVLDDDNALVTEGDLTMDCVPRGAGDAISITVSLALIEGPGGPYSYRLDIPFETETAYVPASDARLGVTADELPYTRTMSVAGTNITVSHDITLSLADRGTARRVDVCTTCPAEVRMVHSADVDGDYSFSLGEFLRVYELHSATPTHEYHVDASTEDGYAPGPGPNAGLPHSADYDGGADWRISMSEILRMVDLFSSTSDHSYSPFAQGDDGFQKGSGELVLATASGLAELVTYAYVDAIGIAAPEERVPVTVTVDSLKDVELSALGVTVSLPAGWCYAGLKGAGPAVRPNPMAQGALEFGWTGDETLPLSFTFDMAPVEAPIHEQAAVLAQAAYRVKTGRDERRGLVGRLTLASEGGAGTASDDEVLVAVLSEVTGLSGPTWTSSGGTGGASDASGGDTVVDYYMPPSGDTGTSSGGASRWTLVESDVAEEDGSSLSSTPVVLGDGPSHMGSAGADPPVPVHGPWALAGLLLLMASMGGYMARRRVHATHAARARSHED